MDGKKADVDDRTLILTLVGDQWSACYSDRTQEKAYGITMDAAIDRLTQRRQVLADDLTMALEEKSDTGTEPA